MEGSTDSPQDRKAFLALGKVDKQLPQMEDALPMGDMLPEIPSVGQTSGLRSRKQITS